MSVIGDDELLLCGYNIPSPHLNAPRAKCSQPHQSSKWSAVFLSQMCTTAYNLLTHCRWKHGNRCAGSLCLCVYRRCVCCLLQPAKSYCSPWRFTCAVFLKHQTNSPGFPYPTLPLLYPRLPLMSLWGLWTVKAVMCYRSWSMNTQVLSKFTETAHQRDEWEVRL